MVYFSGKDINDLGNYYGCNNLEGANYVLVDFMKTVGVPMCIGWCLPEQCSQSDIETAFASLLFPPSEELLTQASLLNLLKVDGIRLD